MKKKVSRIAVDFDLLTRVKILAANRSTPDHTETISNIVTEAIEQYLKKVKNG